MEQIAITGINGYIGSNLARALSKKGMRIIGIDLVLNNIGLQDDPNLSCFAVDITDAPSMPVQLKDAGVLIHCAALVHKRSNDLSRENYFRINHAGTKNILKNIDPARLKLIVFLSTVSVYGNIPAGMEADEATVPRPDDFYGESKLAAEDEIRAFSAKNQIPYIILRLSPVYGKSFLLNIHKRICLPGHHWFYRIGDGNQKLSLCSVNNIVSIINKGLHDKSLYDQTFNIRDLENYSINRIISLFNGPGRKKPVVSIPPAIPRFAFSCLSLVLPNKGEYYKYQLRKISMDATYSIEMLRRTGADLPWDLRTTLFTGKQTAHETSF